MRLCTREVVIKMERREKDNSENFFYFNFYWYLFFDIIFISIDIPIPVQQANLCDKEIKRGKIAVKQNWPSYSHCDVIGSVPHP